MGGQLTLVWGLIGTAPEAAWQNSVAHRGKHMSGVLPSKVTSARTSSSWHLHSTSTSRSSLSTWAHTTVCTCTKICCMLLGWQGLQQQFQQDVTELVMVFVSGHCVSIHCGRW